MDLNELRTRIQKWEDRCTEFKLQAIHPDDLFARSSVSQRRGGQLIIGVSNDRRSSALRTQTSSAVARTSGSTTVRPPFLSSRDHCG